MTKFNRRSFQETHLSNVIIICKEESSKKTVKLRQFIVDKQFKTVKEYQERYKMNKYFSTFNHPPTPIHQTHQHTIQFLV